MERLRIILPPEELARKSPIAYASLLFADEVISYQPIAHFRLPQELETAPLRFPESCRFLERTEWAIPLYLERIIVPSVNEQPCWSYLPAMLNYMSRHELWGRLFKSADSRIYGSHNEIMEVFAANVNGTQNHPVPQIVLGAALDYFALEHGLVVAQTWSRPLSGVRASLEIASRFLEYSIPIVRAASGDEVLRARDLLKDQLHPFRLTVQQLQLELCDADASDLEQFRHEVDKRVLPLLKEYRQAFLSNPQLATNALMGVENILVSGLSMLPALVMGAGAAGAAAVGGLTGLAAVATRGLLAKRQQEQRKRTHTLGFLAQLEGR